MANMDNQKDMPELQRDDALFETLGKNKKRKKRKILITVVSILVVIALILVIGVTTLQRRVREQFAASQGEVLSHSVSTGSISTLVSGSGYLTDVDLEEIDVPAGVEISDVEVKRNQTISKGDILATVEMSSVVSAMADLQLQIEDLDDQISDAEDDSASTRINAGVSGRVKAVFGEKGADVADVMFEHGALALISLDGYMAVDIENDSLKVGDSVSVKLSEKDTVSGTVESAVGGKVTVLVTDNGPENDAEVTVLNAGGTVLGTGKLYIHSALRITGYAGTISQVSTTENSKVSKSTRLFTLKDTDYSANYNSLLRQRAELEETLLELLTIQRDGALLAQMDGSVYSVDYDEETVTEDTATPVVTLSNDKKMSVTINVDESDILSLELGQAVSVTVKSVSEDAFTGTLTEVNRTSSSSGVYSAEIEVDKVTGMLSGMTANVDVRIQGVDDAILVPVDAVHRTRDGAYVYTSYNKELREYGGRVDVITGLENSNFVEIKSGLKVGDTVYYTESDTGFFGFGNMGGGYGNMGGGNMGGNMGGGRPDFGGGNMPDMGGNRPGGSGGNRPGGSGGRPSGFGG